MIRTTIATLAVALAITGSAAGATPPAPSSGLRAVLLAGGLVLKGSGYDGGRAIHVARSKRCPHTCTVRLAMRYGALTLASANLVEHDLAYRHKLERQAVTDWGFRTVTLNRHADTYGPWLILTFKVAN